MTELAPVADDFRPYAPVAPAEKIGYLQPTNLEEALHLADLLARSNMLPSDFQGKPQNVLIAMMWADEIGIGYMQGLQSIAVVRGKPSIYGKVGKAMILQRVGKDLIDFQLWSEPRGKVEGQGPEDLVGRCVIVRKNPGGEPITADRSFSWADAVRAGLHSSNTYKAHPRVMLEWRAFWQAAFQAYADLFSGISAAEEQRDIEISEAALRPAATAKVIDAENSTATLENVLGVGKAEVVDVVPEPEPDPTEDCKEMFDQLDLKTDADRKDYIVSTGLPHEQEWTSLPEKDLIELRDCLQSELKNRE